MRSRLGLLSGLLLLGPACSSEETADPAFVLSPTIPAVAADPLVGTELESCPVYQDQQCAGGRQRRCEIYDTMGERFVDAPDPLLRRVFLYDRWYDRYESPLGLTAERVFTGSVAGDATEAEWTDPARFGSWAGTGDAGIWTGAALVSDIFRYAATRTEADYQRFDEKTRALVRSFEVTGVPGYLSRYNFLQLPPGSAPNQDRLILRYGDELPPYQLPIAEAALSSLPADYVDGVDDGQGGKVKGRPTWDGDVSIDQYTGPMTAFPIAYNLLRDEALKQKLVYHLTCYLKRLQRIEVINLKARPDLVDNLWTLFGGSNLKLDPDDPDLRNASRMVWYVHRGINANNQADFDRSCPEQVNSVIGRVIDARSPTFESELLELATDLNRDIRTRPNQIDHYYIVSLRGGDASHLMHLAAIAYYLTGEEQYRKFLFDVLIGDLKVNEVARTMMAFRLPDWCFRFYGDHITYGTHWQFLTMLPEGDLKREMVRVMEEEAWQKALYNHDSAKFNVMYAATVDSPDRQKAIDIAVSQLRDFGGNGGTLEAPRRTYNRDRGQIIAALPAGTTIRCPTEAERLACEDGGSIFGFPLESSVISYACDGRPGECLMADGKCVEGLASTGLPPRLRGYADFMWQRSPFNLGDRSGVDGGKQSPGRDLTEPYWLARYYGFITEGRDQVLAWRDTGPCE